jgi:3-phosphoshikimate 1-carboxyvinyltransferase
VSDAEELRHKESDRITSLVDEFRTLGAHIDENRDGYFIEGGVPLAGGTVKVHGDHRLAMALSIAGLASSSPVTIQGAEVISESFPDFIEALQQLGAIVIVEAS